MSARTEAVVQGPDANAADLAAFLVAIPADAKYHGVRLVDGIPDDGDMARAARRSAKVTVRLT